MLEQRPSCCLRGFFFRNRTFLGRCRQRLCKDLETIGSPLCHPSPPFLEVRALPGRAGSENSRARAAPKGGTACLPSS